MSRWISEHVSLLRLLSGRLIEKGLLGGSSREGPADADAEYCQQALERTSRSFAAVILMLGPELRTAVSLFYLVLRGLDAVEDDMTLELEVKKALLLGFSARVSRSDSVELVGVGPSAGERDLLEHLGCVARQLRARLSGEYRGGVLEGTRSEEHTS